MEGKFSISKPKEEKYPAEEGEGIKTPLAFLRQELPKIFRKFDQEFGPGKQFSLVPDGLLVIQFESQNSISIHLGERDASHDSTHIVRDYERLLQEMYVLGGLLEKHQGLRNIEEILAYSWIVTKHKNALVHLGFRVQENSSHPLLNALKESYACGIGQGNIPEEYRDIPPSLAIASKAEFVERYGSHQAESSRI